MVQTSEIEDRLAIQELNQQYAAYIDMKNVEPWVALFTPDAIFDEVEFDGPLSVGHDAIREYGNHLVEIVQQAIHHMTTHVVNDLTASTATGIAFASVDGLLKNGHYSRSQVIYFDKYVKVDGRWLFAERVLKNTLPQDVISEATS